MAESALIVCVPEAEPVVRALREQFDPSAQLGVPAHVTVLYPFMPPERITATVLQRVRLALSESRGFVFRLTNVGRFPENLHLVLEPSSAFVALTESVVREFPEFPPYSGQYQSVIPHLTVAQGNPWHFGAAETPLRDAMLAHGSIRSHCSAVELIENSLGRWHQRYAFRLAHAA